MKQPIFLPYCKHSITREDIDEVTEILRSDWLTQGPIVSLFEDKLAEYLGAREVVAISSSASALQLALLASGIKPGDKVIIPTNAFVDIPQAIYAIGASICIADIDPATGLIDPNHVTELLENDIDYHIKAIIPLHFAGQPANLPALSDLAQKHQAVIIDHAEYALGAAYSDNDEQYRIGANPHCRATIFSFRAGQHITTGAGGAVTTNDSTLADRIRRLRNHDLERSVTTNRPMAFSPDGIPNPWYYEAGQSGFDYCLTEMQAALGLSQLKRASDYLQSRRTLARKYDQLIIQQFTDNYIRPQKIKPDINPAFGLYVILVDFDTYGISRAAVMNRMRSHGIATQVHYPPLHLQPRLIDAAEMDRGSFPGSARYYAAALTLPLYTDLTEEDLVRIIDELKTALTGKMSDVATGENINQSL